MTERQAGAEIEVTPEMIEAGFNARGNFDDRFEPDERLMVYIYRAMEGARRAKSEENVKMVD